MKNKLPFLCSLLLLALFVNRASAQAVVVNFNFAYEGYVTNYSGQGAYSDAGHDYWNRVGVNTTEQLLGYDDNDEPIFQTVPAPYAQDRATMYAADGTTTTALRIVFADESFANGDSALFAPDLYNTYFYNDDVNPKTFTISGLTAGQAYDFYFYAATGDSTQDRAALFTLDGNSLGLTGMLLNSFSEGDNYLKFSLTPSGTTLSGSFVASLGSSWEADFAGLQIVTTATPVPEPATSAVICASVALAGVIAFRRRQAGPVVS